MPNNQKKFTGQTFNNQAVLINGEIAVDPQISIARRPFLLERYDFEKITNSNGLLFVIAQTFLGATIGLFINMFAKLIGSKIDTTIKFDNWEVFAFLLSLFLTCLFYVIDYLIPNERRRIIKSICQHFESNSNTH